MVEFKLKFKRHTVVAVISFLFIYLFIYIFIFVLFFCCFFFICLFCFCFCFCFCPFLFCFVLFFVCLLLLYLFLPSGKEGSNKQLILSHRVFLKEYVVFRFHREMSAEARLLLWLQALCAQLVHNARALSCSKRLASAYIW